jgi:outer membrane protein assembly factor BamE (lipoprotein component of BamABCDE complex)
MKSKCTGYKRIAYIVLTLCFFSSCTTYSNYSDKLNKVNVGMTKTEVLNLMGNPNDKNVDDYGDEAWQFARHVLVPSRDIYTIIMFYNDRVTAVSSDDTRMRIDWEKSPGFIKAKHTEDEAKAKELGYPSVEAYNKAVNEAAEKKREDELYSKPHYWLICEETGRSEVPPSYTKAFLKNLPLKAFDDKSECEEAAWYKNQMVKQMGIECSCQFLKLNRQKAEVLVGKERMP